MNKILDDIPVPDEEFDRYLIDLKFRRFLPYIHGKVLDVGCGVGIMTQKLFDAGFNIEGLDGSAERISEAVKRVPQIMFHTALFNDFRPTKNDLFDTLIVSNVLEHFSKVGGDELLQLCRDWLNPKGTIICAVPNRNALHKIVARSHAHVFKKELTDADILVGHHTTYDFVSLSEQLRCNGFCVTDIGGVLLKPAPNFILKNVSISVLAKLFTVSNKENLFDLCNVIYVVAKK